MYFSSGSDGHFLPFCFLPPGRSPFISAYLFLSSVYPFLHTVGRCFLFLAAMAAELKCSSVTPKMIRALFIAQLLSSHKNTLTQHLEVLLWFKWCVKVSDTCIWNNAVNSQICWYSHNSVLLIRTVLYILVFGYVQCLSDTPKLQHSVDMRSVGV